MPTRRFQHPRYFCVRLNAKNTERELRLVIWFKSREWKGTEMARHLVPKTLFAPKHFDTYLDDAREAFAKEHPGSPEAMELQSMPTQPKVAPLPNVLPLPQPASRTAVAANGGGSAPGVLVAGFPFGDRDET